MNQEIVQFDPFIARPNVLVVDDDVFSGLLVKEVLCHLGALVHSSYDEADLRGLIEIHHYDLIVLDWRMRHLDGEAILKNLDQANQALKVVLYTGSDLEHLKVPWLTNINIVDYWQKPMTMSTLTKKSLRLFDPD